MLKSVIFMMGAVAGQICGGRGLPLVGPRGFRLFCGGRYGSVDCPAGSSCEQGLCCPLTVMTTVTPVTAVTPVITPVNVVAKCQSGSPAKDVLGIDIDCSINACPLGSECIVGPNGVFHACCALPGFVAPAVPAATIVPAIIDTLTSLVPVTATATATASVVLPKCQTGMPLTDLIGAELACGPALPQCPLGSECVIGPNGVYSACCPLAASASLTVVIP